jgi:predicted acyltransferase
MIALAGIITYMFAKQHTPYETGNYHEQEKRMALTITLLCIGVIVNSVYRILSSTASKKWAFIFFVSGISALFILIPSLYDIIKLFTMKQVHVNCSQDINWEYRFNAKAWHFALLYMPVIGLSFYLLKRLHSKPE